MRKYHVLALGELNADLIVTGLKSMPVPGREIIAGDARIVLGSSTAISASGLARLGLNIGFLGKVGADFYGDIVRKALEQNGVDLSHIIIDECIPPGLTISLSTETDRALVTCLGSIAALKAEDVDTELFSQCRHIHVGSFFLQSGLRPGLAKLFEEAHRRGATTSLDAGWDDTGNWDYGIRDVLSHTDIFFPNESEALMITKKSTVEEASENLSEYCRICVIKMGAEGACVRSGKTVLKKPPYDVVPIDKTGAGDSFNAGFLYGFIMGKDLGQCLDYGNACASISVTRIGGATSCASLEEVQTLMRG